MHMNGDFVPGHLSDDKISVYPLWVRDAVFYQIFPDRFANGDPANDPPGVEQWNAKPTPRNFFGGDIQGIIDRLPYLKDLGINALYLNPVFSATTNHKYNTADYKLIDPSFGTNELFKIFLDRCHQQNIRIVIDGVFNHTGVAHWAFQDIVKYGAASQYAGWYNIYSFPVGPPAKPNYECWWNHGGLPKLMVHHPDVKNYLFEVTSYWTKMGIDGWRLDVPNEIPHEFWKEWRKLVKSINPDCYIVGEIWDDATAWLKGDEFDGVMNYQFRTACLDYFYDRKTTPAEFDQALARTRASYPNSVNYSLQNLLGSHDTERIATLCEDPKRRILSYVFQMTYVGAPMIYYGDEIGMKGGKDPDCRRTMIWDERMWDSELRGTIKSLITIRNRFEVLRSGEYRTILLINKDKIFIFERNNTSHSAIVCINSNPAEKTVVIDSAGIHPRKKWTFLFPEQSIEIVLPPISAVILIGE
jgi:cyclomaltodextrinase